VPLDASVSERVGAEALAAQVAAALRAIHAVPPDLPVSVGTPDLSGTRWVEHITRIRDRFRQSLLPHLDGAVAEAATAFLHQLPDLVADVPEHTFVHRDLGATHLLCDDDGLVGVIDWANCCVADPAVDLSWLLHGAPPAFARHLVDTLRPDEQTVRRALAYHRLQPWFEAEHGLREEDETLTAGGLRRVAERLATFDR
jgi:aminoglycoside phosphotransferase (APT) family kinase protein